MQGIDVLADVLAAARIGGTLICNRRMTPPWGIRFVPAHLAGFHLITRGSFWLRMDDGATIQLAQGDLVFLPHGSGHDLLDEPRTHPVLFEDLEQPGDPDQPECALEGSGGAPAGFICGAYAFDAEGAHPVLSLLPPLIHIRAEQLEASRSLQRTLEMLRQEVIDPGPGTEAVRVRLVEVLFVYIVRAWLAAQPEGRAGWLGALRDPQIGRVLERMHAGPAQPWTVEGLAREASLSRAAFARRFTSLVGEPPLAYLTRLRMERAARLLRDTTEPVGRISTEVGYDSEFAFNKAFKRARGVSPGRWRREAGGGLAPSNP
jgi:AraC-like DNA-binding protein